MKSRLSNNPPPTPLSLISYLDPSCNCYSFLAEEGLGTKQPPPPPHSILSTLLFSLSSLHTILENSNQNEFLW